jgi:hypothetical protein
MIPAYAGLWLIDWIRRKLRTHKQPSLQKLAEL